MLQLASPVDAKVSRHFELSARKVQNARQTQSQGRGYLLRRLHRFVVKYHTLQRQMLNSQSWFHHRRKDILRASITVQRLIRDRHRIACKDELDDKSKEHHC